MENGLIHVYCGDGKGKTTAAMGLALRAAGSGKTVLIGQFFKDGTSSELAVLRKVAGVTVYSAPAHYGRYARMNENEREAASNTYHAYLSELLRHSAEFDMLVLDEVFAACRYGMVNMDELLRYLDGAHPEVVMTGREPQEQLVARADYLTEMQKIHHPFDKGIPSRKGIEF